MIRIAEIDNILMIYTDKRLVEFEADNYCLDKFQGEYSLNINLTDNNVLNLKYIKII